ncbi:aminoglycoside phosphotransferase family protein [Nocardiopsis dassonvillei]|uniref:aminoglycoside phosphotransferase family protein n=1 Tax=Nocardiopsis dassonvillei TaxID=2014 RepID=UPI00366BC8CC
MATGFSTHHLEFNGELVTKRYTGWRRGEPYREWAALTVLNRYAPGLAPRPVTADLAGDPPTIVMSRLPGRVLRGQRATDEQVIALTAALARLHQIPTAVVETIAPAAWGPATAVAKVRALADACPDLGNDALVREARVQATEWLATTEPDELLANPYPPVLGLADGNHANLLWDQDTRCVRLVDWEDSGRTDRAFEIGELVEHISRIDGSLDTDLLLAHIPLAQGEDARVRGFRRLVALGWFFQLGPSGAASPHNPPGTVRQIAERIIRIFG